MRLATGAAIVLLLTVSAVMALSEQPDSPPSPFEQWLPGESYPGEKQYDARLDQPVRFWGAGMPLKQVFESIRQQTGVEIGFFPPGDMNERVCVNLYLNSDEPPSLRELLAQLAWVTDCAFGCERQQEGPRYALLGTSIRGDIMAELWRVTWQAWRDRDDWQTQAQMDMWASVTGRLDEFAAALDLTPAQLQARYHGADDILAFTMSSPSLRAAITFLSSLPQDQRSSGFVGSVCRKHWPDLTEEQRSDLRTALAPGLERQRQAWNATFPREHRCPPLDWGSSLRMQVEVEVSPLGGFVFAATLDYEGPLGDIGGQTLFVPVVPPHPDLGLDAAALMKTPEALPISLLETSWEDLAASAARRAARKEAERQLRALAPVSPEVRDLLTSTQVSVGHVDGAPLWAVQEAVAALAGLNVVSDCFWQPDRPLQEYLALLGPGATTQLDLLTVLRLHCLRLVGRDSFWHRLVDQPWRAMGWEWGDAGAFLHFRSPDRDLWRAGFLPESAIGEINSWLEPELPEVMASDGADPIRVPIEPKRFCQLVADLAEPQRRWGGHLIYSDPTDEIEYTRFAFRGYVLGDASEQALAAVMLAGLTDQQWERIATQGLRYGMDFTPALRPDAPASLSVQLPQPGELVHVLGLTPDTTELVARKGLSHVLLVEIRHRYWGDEITLPSSIRVYRLRPRKLLGPHASAPEATSAADASR